MRNKVSRASNSETPVPTVRSPTRGPVYRTITHNAECLGQSHSVSLDVSMCLYESRLVDVLSFLTVFLALLSSTIPLSTLL